MGNTDVLIILVFGVPALLLLVSALLPNYLERARAVVRVRPWPSFLLGLVNILFFVAVALLVNVPQLAILGGISLLLVVPLLVLAGLVVAAGIVGAEVLFKVAGRAGSRLGALLLGILLLYLTLLVPVFGWLLFLGLISAGLGAAIFSLVQRPQTQPEPTE